MLTGSTNEDKIWNYFISQGLTEAGTAGLMGNIYAESGFIPNNFDNNAEKKLGISDEEFTKMVDDGSYTNFVHDGYGYGLVQWTFWSVKEDLLNFAKQKCTSIGDMEMQLECILSQLGKLLPKVLNTLKTTDDIKLATDEVLMNYERPQPVLDPNSQACEDTKQKRYNFAKDIYNKHVKKGDSNMAVYTNSPLATVTLLTDNCSKPRNHIIDRLTIHSFVGQVTAQRGCEVFIPKARQASVNYVVGKDGSIGLNVEEKNRAWTSSSSSNDNRAITIEVACGTVEPYEVYDVAYKALLDLCADICQRNGKTKLLWFNDKNKSLNYSPKSNEMVMTIHKWFAATSCPNTWLLNHMQEIADTTNKRISGGTTVEPPKDALYRIRKSWTDAKSQIGAFSSKENAISMAKQNPGYFVYDGNGVQVYPPIEYKIRIDVDNLNIRTGPGTNYPTTGLFTGKGAFTVIGEATGPGASIWLQLKSGAGWISGDFCTKL